MVTNELERWGLHLLEGSGYVAHDAGSIDVKPVYEVKNNVESKTSGVKLVTEAKIRASDSEPLISQPAVAETRRKDIEPVALPVVEIKSSDIIPVDDFGEPIAQRVHVPAQYSEPPLQSPPNTLNDALIALALHEEFQKLAAAEAAGQASAKEKESVLVQSWAEKPASESSSGEGSLDHTERDAQGATTSASVGDNYGHVTVYNWEGSNEDMERGKAGSVPTTSSSQDPYSLDEDDRQIALTLAEEHQHVDREVANRLTKLESMQHVPRTNQAFPTFEDASADHKRLADRLLLYGLTEQKIKGDGNCQFRALSDQLYRTPEHHKHVRKQVVKQLKQFSQVYQNYVPMKYSDYLKHMAKNGEWGDHVTLQAASDHFGVRISLITSFKDTCFVEIKPAEQKSKREIYLSFWAEIHYNSIYPIGDIYSYAYAHQHHQQQQSKKRHWIERLF